MKENKVNPVFLFHGSTFLQKELMPGFKRSHIEVRWDINESNHFLYATSSKKEAIALGFGSAIEKHFNLKHYSSHGDTIKLEIFGTLPTKQYLSNLSVFLYTIQYSIKDKWVLNNNEYNGMTTEYKTENTISDNINTVTKVNLNAWLKTKKIIFNNGTTPLYLKW